MVEDPGIQEGANKPPLAEILNARRDSKKIQREEKIAIETGLGIGGSIWHDYGHNYPNKVLDYDIDFEDALKGLGISSLQEYVSERKKAGLPTNVLDLMGGDPSFMRDLQKQTNHGIDRGLSTGLADDRTAALRDSDKKLNIDVLNGDLMSKNTWRQIDSWQKENGVPFFVPLNPTAPADDDTTDPPFTSDIVTIVLLKVAFTWAIPLVIPFLTFIRFFISSAINYLLSLLFSS